MNYWDGINWVAIPPGNNGNHLVFCNGVPSWNCTPRVLTLPIFNITPNTVSYEGNVIYDGGLSVTNRGIVIDTNSSPTLLNRYTNDGAGLGNYSSTISGLNPLTTYYVRAYATNSLGTSYGNEVSFSTSPPAVGMYFGGGIVFYLDGSGQHGLICAPSDQSAGTMWGCVGITLPGNFYGSIGSGQSNSNLILNGCGIRPIAASLCENLLLGGYNDWYLPSRGELTLMHSNLHTQGIGNFNSVFGGPAFYWSSTQDNAYSASIVDFNNGRVELTPKDYGYRVRAVRSF
jgi:hypothetical protein